METKDWYAYIDSMPPKPDHLHVIGEVYVPNPGVKAYLCPREPQEDDSTTLLLDLHLVQEPGVWPQIMTWIQARYDKVLSPTSIRYKKAIRYKKVEIFSDGKLIAQVGVKETR